MGFYGTCRPLIIASLGLVLLLVGSYGEIVMIHDIRGNTTRLTCVSEDDGAALVVNYDLNFSSMNSNNSEKFKSTQPWNNTDCPIIEQCLAKWRGTDDWNIVHSTKKPIGPVFDARWEDFPEYNMSGNKRLFVLPIRDSGTVIFSVRSIGTIELELCRNNLCSVISTLTAPNQITETRSNLSKICIEETTLSKLNESFISEHKWRTFVLQLNRTSEEVKTYEVNQSETLVEHPFKNITEKILWNEENYLFMKGFGPGLARFHFYRYILTEKPGTEISYQFEYPEKDFCIQLLVALCSTCAFKVYIENSDGSTRLIKIIDGVNETSYGKLLTWQISTLSYTLPTNFRNSIKLTIATRLIGTRIDGRWAIGHFRTCARPGAVRQSEVMTIHKSTDGSPIDSRCYEPIIRCQKLFYNENAVVSSHVKHAEKVSSSLENCLCGRGDPSCEFPYPDEITVRHICNPFGCTCGPGFQFGDCIAACRPGTHRYDCRTYRTSCKNNMCDKSTGSCSDGCSNDRLPPYCETNLTAPDVTDITDTTALLYYPVDLDWGRESSLSYVIRTEEKLWGIVTASLGDILISRMFETPISNLAPDTMYFVEAKVMTKWSPQPIISPKRQFVTQCLVPSLPLNLEVMVQGRGVVTLKWNYSEDSLIHVIRFNIYVNFLETRLQKNLYRYNNIERVLRVETYEKKYSQTLNLPASTKWNFLVKAANKCGSGILAAKDFWVPPSVGFRNGQKIDVTRHETFMTVKIPALVNTTVDTSVKVIIKGSPACAMIPLPEELQELVNITNSGEGWIAAMFPARENEPKYLTVGNDSSIINSVECDLRPNETYVIVIVVTDEFEQTLHVISSMAVYLPITSIQNDTLWRNFIWLVIVPVMLMCLLLVFRFYWRLKNNYASMMSSLPLVEYHGIVPSSPPIDNPASDWLYDCCPHPTTLMTFENHVQTAIKNGKLKSEFAMLPRGLVRPHHCGSLPKNKFKNRSQHVIAYDDTRVKLENRSESVYINANYIQGYCKEKAYIATQAPMSGTMTDFWEMIWQEEVRVICMMVDVIEDGKIVCEQYWPEIGKTMQYGNVVILNLNQATYAHYTYRTFQLTTCQGMESRQVRHLQYTGWPKQGVPMYSHSIVEYLDELRATPCGPGPVVVHCSTGTGRTGTIILSDICVRYAAAEGTVNLFAEAMKMYNARANMLDNVQQYILTHLMPTECLLLLPTKLPCSDISLANIKEMKKHLPTHMRRLGVSAWKDKALQYPSILPFPLNPDHLAKNRFPKFTPVDNNLVKLKRYPKHDSNSEYISAISVDGMRAQNQYFASQLPLPSTLSDFWRLVAEKKVELVVILQDPDPKDVSCIDIIPREASVNPVPYITIETKISTFNEHFITDQLLLTDESQEESRTQNITVLTCNNWDLAEDAEPPPPEVLVSLWSASEKVSRSEGPTLVLCHDGVTGCGLYMALSILLERMAVEHECDVISAVQVIRQARSEFVYTKAQFEYLYDAALNFSEEFQTYSNFT